MGVNSAGERQQDTKRAAALRTERTATKLKSLAIIATGVIDTKDGGLAAYI
jgi:hypothetical protein